MDSFYDAPRKAPVPASMDKVLPVPVVPEVSIIADDSQYNCANPWNHSKWKTSNNIQDHVNKENCNDSFILMSSGSSMIRKQVRFENPVLRDPGKLNVLQSASSYNTNNTSNNKQIYKTDHLDRPHCHPQTWSQKFDGQNFQQIYMSNIPNRHLDLSMLDLNDRHTQANQSKHFSTLTRENTNNLANGNTESNRLSTEIKENQKDPCDPAKDLPQTYKDFLSLQKNLQRSKDINNQTCKDINNDSVTDILNYRRSPRISPQLNKVGTKTPLRGMLPQRSLEKSLTGSEKPHDNKRQVTNAEHKNCFSVTPLTNKPNPVSKPPTPVKCDTNTQTTNIFSNDSISGNSRASTEIANKPEENEPSVKDLVKIIQQQNEQLLLLQKQVSSLIERSDKQQRQIEGSSADMLYSKKYVTSTQHEICNNPIPNTHTPRKGPLSKFSIDMMTSFEVSFRRQQNEKFRRKVPDFVSHEPQIQEVTETESATSNVLSGILPVDTSCDRKRIDSSLYLQEPLVVREDCPSPEPSIKIDMNDYDSSDEESTDEVPMAVYANVMDQIEKFLKNTQTNAFPGKVDCRSKPSGKKTKNTTMSKVKEATLKHLRSIGVNLTSVNDSDSSEGSEGSCNYSPSEVSFAVKQLLMKYLPDEYLGKLNKGQAQVEASIEPEVTSADKNNFIPQRPEFSFATVQYMKKYNLLGDNIDQQHKTARVNNMPVSEPVLPPKTGQILDITTLKLQPKLL